MSLSRSKRKTLVSSRTAKPDHWLSICVFLLLSIGLITVFSASVVLSRNDGRPDNYYFFSQFVSVFISFFALYIGYKIDYNFWKKLSPVLLIIGVFLLFTVFIPGVGIEANGAKRWINIGFTTFQPSEAMKIALILYLATWFEMKGKDVADIKKTLFPFSILLLAIIIIVLLMQRDMGTALVTIVIAGIMFFTSGAKISHLVSLFSIGCLGLIALIKLEPYRVQRVLIFLNPGADKTNAGYQISQALLTVGSGGLWGLGFGQSRQKFNYLPEPATDSIFAIICEELGMIRASLIVFLFVFFAYRGYIIARNAPDCYSRLVATGITTWIITQAFINIMAILSLIPLTGVPLPFISYGGSSLIMLMFSCGLLLNISRHSTKEGR